MKLSYSSLKVTVLVFIVFIYGVISMQNHFVALELHTAVFKILMNLKERVSFLSLFVEYDVHHFNVLLRNSITGFIKGLEVSANSLLKEIVMSQFYIKSTLFT